MEYLLFFNLKYINKTYTSLYFLKFEHTKLFWTENDVGTNSYREKYIRKMLLCFNTLGAINKTTLHYIPKVISSECLISVDIKYKHFR